VYERILVAIDAHPTEENASAIRRTEQIGTLTGATVHVLHVARGHIVPEDITGGSARLGVWSAEDDAEDADRAAVQQLVDRLSAAGIDAHGEMVVATEHDAADVILHKGGRVDLDTRDRDRCGRGFHFVPAQRGSNACDEFGALERFDDIVVGSELEPRDDVGELAARREHHDRDLRPPPHAAADLEPVDAGQHHVEEDQVETVLLDPPESIFPGRGALDLDPGALQEQRSALTNRLVVFDQQHAGGHNELSFDHD